MTIIGETAYTAVPTSIVNYCSDGGVFVDMIDTNTKVFLSGVLTADTYKSILSIPSGRGVIFRAGVKTNDSTSRTVGLKIVLDGTTVFDAISSVTAQISSGLVGIGDVVNAGPQPPVPFNTSLDIQIKSSLTETDKISLVIMYAIM